MAENITETSGLDLQLHQLADGCLADRHEAPLLERLRNNDTLRTRLNDIILTKNLARAAYNYIAPGTSTVSILCFA
ncbi:MAG: hypothetical protein BMS9Abin36_0743 [Gammaproteobacteria bacterium]|nr:MAG: hypothetical protein BMS9Abin36_0743 [Gammaproteobacteria bacterium]